LQEAPYKKAMKKMRANIKEVFGRPWLWKIDKYINHKFTQWYNRKKQSNYRLRNAAKDREVTLQAGLTSIYG
jgi:RNA-directed DNA polymerase